MATSTWDGSREPEAGRPGADGHALQVHGDHGCLTLNPLEGKVRNVWQAVLRSAVVADAGNPISQVRFKVVAQSGDPRGHFRQALHRQPRRLAQPDDAGDILGSRPALALVAPARHEGNELNPFANVENADSLGRMDLVPRKRQQV